MGVDLGLVGTPLAAMRNDAPAHSRYAFQSARSGRPSRKAGSSIWMMPMPAFSRSSTSSRMRARAAARYVERGWSSRTKDHCRIVTGPVSMPFIGCGSGLGVGCPVDRHRLGAARRRRKGWRLHAARAVGCTQPTAEGIALQLLAEIFDHVVALGLAVHQHVQSQRFLLAHAAGDFRSASLPCLLLQLRSPALSWLRPGGFPRLREGADGGGRVGQLQQAGCAAALGHRALALAMSGVDFGDRGLDLGYCSTRASPRRLP